MGAPRGFTAVRVATWHALLCAGGLEREIKRGNPIVATIFKEHTVF